MKEFMQRPESKIVMKACEEDLEHVEHAAELFNETTSKIMIKVSCMVLVVLCLMPFLEVPTDDLGDWQSIMQLDPLSAANKTQQICNIVQQYCSDSKNALLFLALNFTTQWQNHCSLSSCTELLPQGFSTATGVLDMADDAMEARGLQMQEYLWYCLPGTECSEGSTRSLVLFDQHELVRSEALQSLAYTALAIFMMFGFVYVFSSDLRMLKKGVLLPMWDLLDDMAAMKVLEFARARDLSFLCEISPDQGPIVKGHDKLCNQLLNGTITCVERCMSRCRGNDQEPEEIRMLKVAFQSMRKAMRSWAKYVPASLVKRLVMADQEAQLGVIKKDVTVMFVDMMNFDELVKGKAPEGVLQLLCHVQEAIAGVIEASRGTLLEMIGDEMLAVYNAPFPVHNHTAVAVKCACDVIQEAEKTAPNVQLRVGVHRAEVLAGNIGSKNRLKYGVLGDGVNTAARLKSLNSQFGTRILTSEHTINDANDVFGNTPEDILSRPAGYFCLKGRKQATKIWQVVGFRENHQHRENAAIDLHKQAFRSFLDRRWDEARDALKEVHAALASVRKSSGSAFVFRDDFLSKRLLQLCDKFLVSPPDEGWDGSEVLAKK
jgi:class 3 adenylate cyclase